MKIIVTEQDIEDGVRRDASNCAVARALRRAGVAHAGVAGTLVLLADGTHHQYVVLPGKVQEWIAEFDAGGDPEPMEFDLALPDWVSRSMTPPVRGERQGSRRRCGMTLAIDGLGRTPARGGCFHGLALKA